MRDLRVNGRGYASAGLVIMNSYGGGGTDAGKRENKKGKKNEYLFLSPCRLTLLFRAKMLLHLQVVYLHLYIHLHSHFHLHLFPSFFHLLPTYPPPTSSYPHFFAPSVVRSIALPLTGSRHPVVQTINTALQKSPRPDVAHLSITCPKPKSKTVLKSVRISFIFPVTIKKKKRSCL